MFSTLILCLLGIVASVLGAPSLSAANNNLTLMDWAKERDPDGTTAKLVHLLSQTNQILEDQVYQEANGVTSHQVTVDAALPEVYWRSYNQHVPSSKATSAQVPEPLAQLESRSVIDAKLCQLANDKEMFRLNQARRFLEAMNQKMARTLFYGNHAVDQKEFTGLSARYSSLSAGNAQNIIDAGGSGSDLMSVWLVGWGDDTVYSLFPQGSKAGLQRKDLGEIPVQKTESDGTISWMQAESELFQWDPGLAVADWRYVVRIANVDVSDLIGLSGTQALDQYATNLIYCMVRAIDRIPQLGLVKPAFYMNRTARSALAIHAMQKTQNVLDIEKGVNQFRMNFLGIKCHLVDQLLTTEDRVA